MLVYLKCSLRLFFKKIIVLEIFENGLYFCKNFSISVLVSNLRSQNFPVSVLVSDKLSGRGLGFSLDVCGLGNITNKNIHHERSSRDTHELDNLITCNSRSFTTCKVVQH